MKYEIDMMTGKKDRPVFEVGDLLLHKELDRECRIVKRNLDPKDSGRYLYTIDDGIGAEFTVSRTVLLRDFKYIGDQING